MVYCKLCEKKYSEDRYLAHLDSCIQRERLFTKEGKVNEKLSIIFKLLQKNFGYEKIISYLNSGKDSDYIINGRPINSYRNLILSGGWTPFLYNTAPEIITGAYIQALRNNQIKITARNNIVYMFSYLPKSIYLSPYEEVKPGILSFIVNILKYKVAQELLRQEYRAMSVVEKYDIGRWVYRTVDEHSPYSELRERMNKEKRILSIFISRIYGGGSEWNPPSWDDDEKSTYVDLDIIRILGTYRQNSFEDIKVHVNEFYREADSEDIWLSLDEMERGGYITIGKRLVHGEPTLSVNLTTQGIDILRQYEKQFERKPSKDEPKIKSCSESDFKNFLKGQ